MHPPSKAYRKGLSSPCLWPLGPMRRVKGNRGVGLVAIYCRTNKADASSQSLDIVEWLTVGLCLIEGFNAARPWY
jgi:hypothetical protein